MELIGDADLDIIKRVRDVLSDATMSEILNQDPFGPSALQDAVRQQIFTICTRLRVSLILVNKLMTVSNNLKNKDK
jgi:hypothetical protein